MIHAVELFNATGKWKYSSRVVIPESLAVWDIRRYLAEEPVYLDGLTVITSEWIGCGGFIFVDRRESYPLLIMKK